MKAIYARVSTDEKKRKGHSIESQICRSEEYIKSTYHPIPKYKIYSDEGVPATNFKRRTDFKKLNHDIEAGYIDELIFTDYDRIHRDMIKGELYLDWLEKNDVQISCLNDDMSRDTPEKKLFTRLKNSISNYEIEKVAQRTRFGITKAFEKGYIGIGGKAPFGFIRVNKKYEINYEQIEIIFSICKLFTEASLSRNAIIKVIAEEYSIKLDWSTVQNILTSKLYRGVIEYDNVEYDIPKIIDDSLLDEKIEYRLSLSTNKKNNIYLFLNKLRCNCCGNILVGSCTVKPKKTYLYYLCSNIECICFKNRISEERVIMKYSKIITEVYKKSLKYNFNNNFESSTYADMIKRNQSKQSKLLDSFIDTIISEKEYLEKKKQLLEEQVDLEQKFNESLDLLLYNKHLKRQALQEHLGILDINLVCSKKRTKY